MNPLHVMSYSKIRFNIVLVSDILSDFTTTVLCKFLLFEQPDSSVGIPVGARVFIPTNRSARLLGPPSFLLNGYWVKHSGREVYHSSPPTAEVDEWVELYLYFPRMPS